MTMLSTKTLSIYVEIKVSSQWKACLGILQLMEIKFDKVTKYTTELFQALKTRIYVITISVAQLTNFSTQSQLMRVI
jgi:hypothetical protein